MSQTSQAAEYHEAHKSSISQRLLRLVGVQPLETSSLEPDELQSVLAFRGLTSFNGLPIPTFIPTLEAGRRPARPLKRRRALFRPPSVVGDAGAFLSDR
jgi:hypothetical protein